MTTGRHRAARHTRKRTLGALALALTLVAAGGTMETAHAVTPPDARFAGFAAEGVVPLRHGHSHNDYERRAPLLDALSRGYTSVEVDVVLVAGQLLVGHDWVQALAGGRTLRSLYLDPLADWVERNDGAVFSADGPPLTLLVDMKSDARRTWRALERVLAGYADMLTRIFPDGATPGAVSVIVSGARAADVLAAEPLAPGSGRFTAVDGRVENLAGPDPAPASVMPLISERWGELFRWKGTGTMPAAELNTLRRVVEAAHAQGRRVRFYATPDRTAAVRENVWRAELAAGVDLLNIDDLAGGQRFLLAQRGGDRPAQTASEEPSGQDVGSQQEASAGRRDPGERP